MASKEASQVGAKRPTRAEQREKAAKARKQADAEQARVAGNVESVAQGELAAKRAVELDQGFRGHVPDPRPNEDYTVAGAAAGKSPSAAEARLAGAQADAEAGAVSGSTVVAGKVAERETT